ncbi:MAG: 3'(2'),5'-bisphosphate nucleotidase [Gemmatimonadetes bacterium]|nr:3'(2'),5'-bisphosphate nucleotidase [Gemmatimonadota bacterium]
MSYAKEMEVAREAARAAALLCEDVRREMVSEDTFTKKDKSPVTVADFGAQALICRRLAREFPKDSVVGEEDAHALRAEGAEDARARVADYVGRQVAGATEEQVCDWIDHGNGQVGPRYWTLDPIDGTKGFVRGDQYAVALALVEGGDLKVGVLACPYLPVDPEDPDGERGVLFTAIRGEGAQLESLRGGDARSIRVVPSHDVANLRMVESVESGHGDHSLQGRVAANVGVTRESVRMDSQAKYGAVARGQAALYLRLPSPKTPDYRENIWDHAAGALVVEEAGGKVTDVRGRPLDFANGSKMHGNRGVVVSNGTLHADVLAQLAGIFG